MRASSRPALVLRSAGLILLLAVILYAAFLAEWAPADLPDARAQLLAWGDAAPYAALGIQALGVLLLFPGFLLILTAALLFGLDSIWISLLGMSTGAILAHQLGRHLGHDFVARLLGQRLLALERALSDHAFQTLLTIRLIGIMPGPIVAYAPGFVGVRLRTVAAAAVLGQLPLLVVLGLLSSRLHEVHQPSDLIAPAFLVAAAALVLIMLAPVLLVLLRRRQRQRGEFRVPLPGEAGTEASPTLK